MIYRLLCTLTLFFCAMSYAHSQIVLHFSVDREAATSEVTSAPDSLLQQELKTLHDQGYLSAGVDALFFSQDTLFAKIKRGPKLSWEQLQLVENPNWDSHSIPLPNSPLSPTEVQEYAHKVLEQFDNTGYPFAIFRIATELSEHHQLTGYLEVEPGPLVLIDSVVIKSLEPVPVKFIQSLLGLQPNTPYNEKRLSQIPQKFRQTSFLKLTQAPEVQFFEDGARVYLYVENMPANQFDGILGFQPEEANRPATITGSIDLKLRNALRAGESIDLNWKRLQNQTQNLKTAVSYPYLLASNLGLGGSVKLYRRDTTFSTSSLRGSLRYLFSLDEFTEVFAERWSSNELGFSGGSVQDVQLTRYGLGYTRRYWDKLIDPRKGHLFRIESSAAEKTENSAEDSKVHSVQYAFQINYNARVPLSENWSLGFKTQGGSKVDTSLSINELYRIGGFSTVRGFNEESIFASTYAIGGLELRYHLGIGVSIMAFIDQAWYEQNLTNYFQDSPTGVGIGLNLNTQNGAFSLLYGLGRTQSSGFLLREGKVHFGFINLF